MNYNISIERTLNSRISDIDFNNLPFGRVFSDHMFIADYFDGNWQKPRVVPFGNLSMHPATSALHYGQSIFEGLKAYRGFDGTCQMFRPDKNITRLNQSARRMAMPELPPNLLLEALDTLIGLDEKWIPDFENGSLYIRPCMFAVDEYIGIKAADNYRFIIFSCPVQSYYQAPVKVKIADHYVRAFPGGAGFAKCAGNYAPTMLPVQQAKKEGYDQILWTDGVDFKYVQEIGTMNVFFHIGDKILTPRITDTILEGVTRDSVLTLLSENGYTIEERDISIDELIEAQEKGILNDAFGTGTAATISQISHLGYKTRMLELPDVGQREVSNWIKEELLAIRTSVKPDNYGWIYKINEDSEVNMV